MENRIELVNDVIKECVSEYELKEKRYQNAKKIYYEKCYGTIVENIIQIVTNDAWKDRNERNDKIVLLKSDLQLYYFSNNFSKEYNSLILFNDTERIVSDLSKDLVVDLSKSNIGYEVDFKVSTKKITHCWGTDNRIVVEYEWKREKDETNGESN